MSAEVGGLLRRLLARGVESERDPEFRSACQSELPVDMLEGVVDGPYRYHQALSDRPAGEPSGGESGDFLLARGEVWWLDE